MRRGDGPGRPIFTDGHRGPLARPSSGCFRDFGELLALQATDTDAPFRADHQRMTTIVIIMFLWVTWGPTTRTAR